MDIETILKLIFILFIGLLVLAAVIGKPVIAWTTIKEFDGEVIRYLPEKDHNALVVIKNHDTGENETFDNEDSLLNWKWNSRDYLALDLGTTYHFKVNGLRFPLFSWSRNLLSATPVTK